MTMVAPVNSARTVTVAEQGGQGARAPPNKGVSKKMCHVPPPPQHRVTNGASRNLKVAPRSLPWLCKLTSTKIITRSFVPQKRHKSFRGARPFQMWLPFIGNLLIHLDDHIAADLITVTPAQF